MKKILAAALTLAMFTTSAAMAAPGGGPQGGGPQGGQMERREMRSESRSSGERGERRQDSSGERKSGRKEQRQDSSRQESRQTQTEDRQSAERQEPQTETRERQSGSKREKRQSQDRQEQRQAPTEERQARDQQQGQQPETMEQGQQPGGMEQGQQPETMEQGQQPGGMEQGQQPGGMEQERQPDGMEQGQMPGGMEQGQQPGGMEQGRQPGGMEQGQQPGEMGGGMVDFDALVTGGIISQETCDNIRTYMEANKPAEGGTAAGDEAPTEKKDLLSDLVSAGIITEAESSAMQAAQGSTETRRPGQGRQPDGMEQGQMPGGMEQGQMPGEMGGGMVDFDALVTGGIISQETCDNIRAYMEANKPAEGGTVTGEEAPAEKKDLLSDLVSAGIITEAESMAIQAAQGSTETRRPGQGRQPDGMEQGQMPGEMGGGMVDFDALVTDGIITQETCDSIRAYMEANKPAEGGATTEGEAPSERRDLLSELVSAGIITEAEATAIQQAQGAAGMQRPGEDAPASETGDGAA